MIPASPARAVGRSISQLERQFHQLVTVYIFAGLLFMLLPGTFLGVWNLISISGQRSQATLSPAWIQAHGHAQIFGWVGTFILGIGFYSLSKMGGVSRSALNRGWMCWSLWTSGVLLRWLANVYLWHWRLLLPLSAVAELAAFLTFFRTVSGHRPNPEKRGRMETWMKLVIGSTIGFLLSLAFNLAATFYISLHEADPAIPHMIDQRFLILATWGFLVPSVWGFNCRWLPGFLGLERASDRGLWAAFLTGGCGVVAALFGYLPVAVALLMIAAVTAVVSLHVFEPARQPAQTDGVHGSFPIFVRGAYIWLLISAALAMWAVRSDQNGGIWGASRHALTVGFISTMVFSIGQRILPGFCGMRTLYSKRLMFASLFLLTLGCALRVGSEIPAYEHSLELAWSILPLSAITELVAVTLFAANLMVTLAPTRSTAVA